MNPAPGHNFTQTLGKSSFDMIWVEGGEFYMGADEGDNDAYDHEKPRHRVKVSGFWMGKYTLNQALWQELMGDNPSRFPGPDLPVEQVSWDDCKAFLEKLKEKTKLPYRFPTEAEWEYAARGGRYSEGYRYAGSDKLAEAGWFGDNSGSQTQLVGLKLPNELGIFDLSGNVWEWCEDWYGGSEYYQECEKKRLVSDPKGPEKGSLRVLRGGSWYHNPRRCRVSARRSNQPDYRSSLIGFRLALPPVQKSG